MKKSGKATALLQQGVKSLEQLRQGDRVKLQPFTPGQREWVDGQVVKKIRPRLYEVQTGGKVYIWNRRHLRKYEPNEDVELATEPPVPQISMQASPALETVEQAPQTTDGQGAVSPEGKQPSPEISPAHEDKGYDTKPVADACRQGLPDSMTMWCIKKAVRIGLLMYIQA